MKKLLVFSCFSALFVAAVGPAAAQITNGLIAYYPFDGNASDASGNGRDATAYNNPTYAAHLSGMAIQLSGAAQYVSLPESIPNSQDLTFAFWIKTSASTASTFPWGYFIASRDIAYANYDWNICIGQGRKIEFHTGTDYNDGLVLATPEDIPSNQWVHVVCVADSTAASKSIYINGQLAATTSWTPHPFANGGLPIWLGNANHDPELHPYLAADYDEVRIYNRALSAGEVLATYGGLVAYYPFDGNTDDASGYGRNATAFNSPSYIPHFGHQAIELSGSSQYVSLPGTIPNDQDLTFALWLKTGASIPSSFPWGYFIASRDIAQTAWDWNICIGQGRKIEFHTGTDYTDGLVLATPEEIPNNQWVHVACVADSTAGLKSIYVNGQLAARTNWTPHPFANNGVPIYLGNATAGTELHPYLAADYDEVQVYNSALSAEQILGLYNSAPCEPHRAAAVASVTNGVVTGATITDAGCGYSNAPSVQITGGGGSGATAHAQVDGGAVVNIVITAGGSGYTNTPIIVIGAPADILIPPYITRQPQNQTAVVNGTATFTVLAGGLSPLSYQWLFGGSPLPGATASALVLAHVAPTNAGVYAVTITNEAGSVTSSNATLTVTLPPAAVRVVPTSGQGGLPVTIPIAIMANGNENAMGFSLTYNPALLRYADASVGSGAIGAALLVNTSQTNTGRLGFALALNPGDTLPAGTQQVVLVTFNAAVLNNPTVTTVGFTDAPLVRQLADTNGHLLPATYSSASIPLAASEFEADLSPRPNGNRIVDISDWVLAGRYAARLDYPTNASEFQRADCAPRDTLGNGKITVSDWVQAGRYAAQLDPLTVAGGPTSETGGGFKGSGQAGPKALRTVRAADALLLENQNGAVSVVLEAQGDENALGFSVSFDTNLLRFQSATAGSAASGAQFLVNSQQAAAGRVGIVVGLPIGNTFSAGSREIAKLNFTTVNGSTGNSPVALIDQPVQREVAGAGATTLTAAFLDGHVSIVPPPSLSIATAGQSGQGISISWPGWGSNFVLESSPALSGPTAIWTNVPVLIAPTNAMQTITLQPTGDQQYYRLRQSP
jgi:hypothetical protein